MSGFSKQLPSLAVSTGVHVVVIVILMSITMATQGAKPAISLESIFTEELPRDTLEEKLELETKPAESLNVMAGGTPSTAVGAAAQPAAAPVDVQKANVMKEVNVRPVLTDMALPSDELLAQELGQGEVTGEIGAMVQGYGDAMGIITQEIIRMMRQEKVTVVWLFDESGSLEDDRKEIRENYLRVYEELGIATQQDEDLRRGQGDQLLTVVASYGETIHEWTARPTGDVEKIKKAIDQVPVDESGKEHMCQSISAILTKYRGAATRGRRKLALIVVSDESGDDGQYVEEAITAAKAARTPIYMMGRESMFGYPYARQRWIHEETGEEFWPRIRRGPETAFPECLQWNGLHGRWGGQSAGFGPYEQVRIAKETGGIFFVLPGDEQNLVGRGANDKRKYDFLAMREYQPLLLSRREYMAERATSPFRETIWQVIARLNPTKNELLFQNYDGKLNIRNEHYPLALAEFQQTALGEVQKSANALVLINEAIGLMEGVRPLRAKEASQRWRAAYDLSYAQLHIFRLRLYQFLLTVDQHIAAMPKPKNDKSNEWNIWWRGKVIVPDEQQFARLKQSFKLDMEREEYLAMVTEEEKKATALLDEVIEAHPGTPWARRAQQEKGDGFGFRVADRLWDPKGVRSTIKVPNL